MKEPRVRDDEGALALLERRGVLALGELAAAVVGGPIAGSWWGHREGKLIYAIAARLEDHPDVLGCKLSGRATFVHRDRWPALLRVVTDHAWRAARMRVLPSRVRRVLARAARGALRIDKQTLSPREKTVLEKSGLVLVTSEHTATGAHATVVRSWLSWAPAEASRQAAALSLEEALATLEASGVRW